MNDERTCMDGETYDEALEAALIRTLRDALLFIRFSLSQGDTDAAWKMADAVHNIPEWIQKKNMEMAPWVLLAMDDHDLQDWAQAIRTRRVKR